jgi:DUF1009 family protein
MAATLGLVAGRGLLPFEVARGARRAGRRVWLAGLRGLTDPALAALADGAEWLHVGEVGALLAALRRAGATEVVLCGGVPKELLFAEPNLVRLDAKARALLEAARDRRDDALQRAVADALEAEGFPVASQAAYVPDLLAPEGPLGSRTPTAAERDDLAFAWPLAKAIGGLDIGQTLVVRAGAVLAVEAIEGTDAAIRRGGRLGSGAVSVVKVWKPTQDPRLDFPVIGPATLATLIEAGGTLLAVEAGRTLVLEREEVVARADAAGVCVLGVPAAGPEGAG